MLVVVNGVFAVSAGVERGTHVTLAPMITGALEPSRSSPRPLRGHLHNPV